MGQKMFTNYKNDLIKEFKNYNGGKFKKDLMAGITVTAVALPLALAFGVSCGASAGAGIITAIISGLVHLVSYFWRFLSNFRTNWSYECNINIAWTTIWIRRNMGS